MAKKLTIYCDIWDEYCAGRISHNTDERYQQILLIPASSVGTNQKVFPYFEPAQGKT